MQFSQAEYAVIAESKEYIAQVARSRQNAGNGPKIVDADLVEFYGTQSPDDTYGRWLSNCVPARITINGLSYASSEHYYQMQKFVVRGDEPDFIAWCAKMQMPPHIVMQNLGLVRVQMATMSPVHVARYGQTFRGAPIRGDWENIKLQVMYDAVLAKFTQNEDFAQALANTGQAVLVERAPIDSVWAINNKGAGTNWLGLTLMVVRNLLE